jgi:hypothetical protein
MSDELVSIITCFSAWIYGTTGGKDINNALEKLES